MEFLSKISEWTIEPVGRLLGHQVGYVIHCKTNLQNLQAKVAELKADRETIENEIAEAERKGEKIRHDVQLWLTKVGEITAQTDELMKDESQEKLKCFYGFCPNLTVRHQLSRKSTKLAQEVVEQHEKRGLICQVSGGVLRKEVWSVTSGDYQDFDSRKSTMEKIMDSLKDSDIQRMGVYGMGGVGKTTLVKEVYKQASEDTMLFDDVVILLDVKKDANLEAIQKKIVEQLRMDILPDETIVGRASRLCGRIQGKKILVILDDVQEKIDLEAMGLPRMPTCKVLVTCRTREVLSFNEMRADKEFSLDLLGKEETWSLFVKMAGDIVKHNSRIRDVAIQVAQKCGGLPLLVVTVASALKGKNKVGEWRDALRRLTRFDNSKEELTEKAYLALEWSYNQLDNRELKQLFLLSGIIVKQNHISVQQLLRYGVGLSLFTNLNSLEEARNALDTLLGKLKNSCLLLDSDTEGVVRMHDLVCHVAKLIAYRDHHMLSIEYGGEFKEWPDKDFLKKCSRISLIHEIIPKLPRVPMECPELELFYLHSTTYDESLQIPSNCFSEMQKLRVLNLTKMYVPSLPLSLQYLKKLQTLCFVYCRQLGEISLLGQLSSLEVLSFSGSSVRELPKEIGQLTLLRLLDLSNCWSLEVISPTVISSLVKLEDLNMRNSFQKWEVEGSNASLSELKHLSQLSSLEVLIPNADTLPANLFSNKLERFNICIGDVWDERGGARSPWEHLNKTMTLNTLKLKLTKELDESLKWLIKNSEYLSLDETGISIVHELNAEDFENKMHLELKNNVDFIAVVNKKVVFPNLETLWVHGCDELKFLFSFSMAKSLVQLTHLKVSSCKLLQEIVSSTKEAGEENMDGLFFKLKILNLEELRDLARFSAGNYIEFPALEELEVRDCYNMGAFIGGEVSMSTKDARSCKEIEHRILEEEEKETAAKHFLFNEKVGFPILERLKIEGIRELKAIWHIQLFQNSFWRLKEVDVGLCNNIVCLFPPSVMGRLNALETLKIWRCDSIEVVFEEIVGAEEEQEVVVTSPQFVFPKVTSLRFSQLPRLTGCINASQWPSLKNCNVYLCRKVGIFASESSHFGKEYETETLMTSQRPLFLTDKDSFHNLEDIRLNDMEIWNGPLPADQLVFGKLKVVSVEGNYGLFSKQISVLFLLRLQNLEEIHFRFNSYETMSGGEEIHDDAVEIATFSRVRCLKLVGMEKLMHLGNDNSQSLFFPNLETLELWWCSRLKSMESSAISFRNLTTLKVWDCHGFEYLLSHSVAKSLVRLKTLEVVDCDNVEVILASYGGDADAAGKEIVFNHLQYLKLNGLKKLQSFCSGNCRVKVPSSITLEVYSCSIKLKASSDGFILTEVEDQCVQKGDDEQQNDTETTTPEILPEENAV